ncbi:hypothetical protein [Micromonospora sp. NBC_00421]|uniref:hypothetical protein n=1 Tax=Micromonospora sp. NBC_00421 TaxID=2975976 RepID=UPI002E22E2DB
MDTLQGDTERRTKRPCISKCDQHPRTTAGCPECQRRNRRRQAARHKATILGTLPTHYIPAAGTARRLQGLTALGYGADILAEHLGVTDSTITKWRTPHTATVTRHTHNAVKQLAGRLDGIPGPSSRARAYAERLGWVPMAAWDDIDAPDARPVEGSTPQPVRERPPSQRHMRWAASGLLPVTALTDTEQALMYTAWCEREQQQGRRAGIKPFARAFHLTAWHARQIARRADQNDTNHNRKVA